MTKQATSGFSAQQLANFTLLHYDKSTSVHKLKEGRLKTAFAANVGIPLLQGMFPLSHCGGCSAKNAALRGNAEPPVLHGRSLYVANRALTPLFQVKKFESYGNGLYTYM